MLTVSNLDASMLRETTVYKLECLQTTVYNYENLSISIPQIFLTDYSINYFFTRIPFHQSRNKRYKGFFKILTINRMELTYEQRLGIGLSCSNRKLS